MTLSSGQIAALIGAGIITGGGAAPAQRLVKVSSTDFRVMAKNSRGTAFEHQFVRNIGGSAPTDSGQSGNQPWRFVGTREFPNTLSNPVMEVPIFTYSNDGAVPGAQDYAFKLPTGKYAGSYHGAETVTAETITVDGVAVDPTTSAASGASIVVKHSSTITDGTTTITITDFTVTVGADGYLTFAAASIVSAAIMSQAYVGMGIASDAYDEATFTLASGGTEYKVPNKAVAGVGGRTYFAQANMISVRKTFDGRTVRMNSNAPTLGGYKRTSTWRDVSNGRTKIYYDFGSASAFGTKSGISWTMTFEALAAGATSFNPNLVTNGDFAANIAGWTLTHNAAGIAWNAGKMRETRAATTTTTRAIQAVTTTIGVPYLLFGENVYTPLSGTTYVTPGSLGLTNNVNGSTNSPAPAYTPTQFQENGYNGHVVIPTATTQYVMAYLEDQSAAGTQVGDTSDFDNLGLMLLAA